MNCIEELMNEFNLKQKDFLDKVGITIDKFQHKFIKNICLGGR